MRISISIRFLIFLISSLFNFCVIYYIITGLKFIKYIQISISEWPGLALHLPEPVVALWHFLQGRLVTFTLYNLQFTVYSLLRDKFTASFAINSASGRSTLTTLSSQNTQHKKKKATFLGEIRFYWIWGVYWKLDSV